MSSDAVDDVLVKHFKNTYKPKASRVYLTLSFTRYSILPWHLALISSLFREIPSPLDDTFEMNAQSFLASAKEVALFVKMCDTYIETIEPIIIRKEEKIGQLWTEVDTYSAADYDKYDFVEYLAASRLCDYLGIEANMTKDLIREITKLKSLSDKVLFHQISMQTNNQSALDYLTEHLSKQLEKISANETEYTEHNYTQHALHCLYFNFVELHDAVVSTEDSIFLRTYLHFDLGWNSVYGYKFYLQ